MRFPVRKKGNKLHAKKVVVDGIEFDSMRESQRYYALKEQERMHLISNLRHHVKYILVEPTYIDKIIHYKTKPDVVKKIMDVHHKGITYEADFVYEICDGDNVRTVVEDVKSSRMVRKDVFKLKKQLMWHIYGIDVKEIYKDNLYRFESDYETERG